MAIGPRKEATFNVVGASGEFFSHMKERLGREGFRSIKTNNFSSLTARAGTSLASSGEEISLKATQVDEKSFRLTVTSQVIMQMVDFSGRNILNVNLIGDCVEDWNRSQSSPQSVAPVAPVEIPAAAISTGPAPVTRPPKAKPKGGAAMGWVAAAVLAGVGVIGLATCGGHHDNGGTVTASDQSQSSDSTKLSASQGALFEAAVKSCNEQADAYISYMKDDDADHIRAGDLYQSDCLKNEAVALQSSNGVNDHCENLLKEFTADVQQSKSQILQAHAMRASGDTDGAQRAYGQASAVMTTEIAIVKECLPAGDQ